MSKIVFKQLALQSLREHWIRCGDVLLLGQSKAQMIKIARADTRPTIDEQRLNMRHARIEIDTDSMFQKIIGRDEIAAAAGLHIVDPGQNDTHIHTTLARLN